MKKDRNAYSPLASSAIFRLRTLSRDFSEIDLPAESLERVKAEIELHEETLKEAFEYRKRRGPELNSGDSDSYFREKLSGMISFSRMVTGITDPEGYSSEKMIENIDHYSHLVAKLVKADWQSFSSRPVSDKTLRETSYERRDDLQRLVDR